MSVHNRVVWSDGLFLKPHHFQQQTLYQDYQAQSLFGAMESFPYGFRSMIVNQELLSLGKVALASAQGVMPDGTVFSFPNEDETPAPVDITEGANINEIIYLCLPVDDHAGSQIQEKSENGGSISRFVIDELAVRDNTIQGGELAAVKVAKIQPQLRLESEDLSKFTKIAVGRVLDKGSDGIVRLDESFYPCMLSINGSPILRNIVGELGDGFEKRAQQIAARLAKPEQTGVAEISDFMLLVALNRFSPLLRHYAQLPNLHPQWVYAVFIQIVGEMATFFDEAKFPRDIPRYDHELPENCWPSVISRLRQILSATLSTSATPIALERKQHGYFIAPIRDHDIYEHAEFVLAVKADVPMERIQREFVKQSKVSSIEDIRKLVHSQLPGIAMHLLPTHPRQLPYHAGYSYFSIDKRDPSWQVMADSEGFAFHIVSQFPGLELQFWAITNDG